MNSNSCYASSSVSTPSYYPVSGNVIINSSNVSYVTSWGYPTEPKKTSVDWFKDIFKATVEESDEKEIKDGLLTKAYKEVLRRKNEGTKSKKELIKGLKECVRESQRDNA